MDRIASLLFSVISLFFSAAAALGAVVADLVSWDYPPGIFDPATGFDADQLQRVAKMQVDDSGAAAGAMFSERAHNHQLFIGDGFTNMGRAALPI